jgi:hypothetical protein
MIKNEAFLFAALIVVILASGCLSLLQPKDCGNNETCFSDALVSCEHAVVKTVTKEERLGELIARYILSAETKGMMDGACIFGAKMDRLDMTGNITKAPDELFSALISVAGKEVECKADVPIELSMQGIMNASKSCDGELEYLIEAAMKYKEWDSEEKFKDIKIQESFCAGGERIIVYMRNTGLDTLSLGDEVKVINATSGTEIPVVWYDFSGTEEIDILDSYRIGQFSTDSTPGINNSFRIEISGLPFPFSVQC